MEIPNSKMHYAPDYGIIYQVIVLRWFYPLDALIGALVLAFPPSFCRVAWSAGLRVF